MADELGADFYTGLNYLGRPASVGVQGESPTASAASAAPTGALGAGPTGSGGTPPSPSGTPSTGSGASTLSSVQQALSILSDANKASKLLGSEQAPSATAGGLDFGPGTSLTSSLPEGQQALAATTPATTGGLDLGVDALSASLPEGEAALSGAEGATAGIGEAASTAGSLAGGAAALIPATLQALQAAGVKIPTPITAAQKFGSTGEVGSGINFAMNPTGGNLANLAESVSTFGLSDVAKGLGLFGDKPPAVSFDTSHLTNLENTVKSSVPQPITPPSTASPEAKAWIDAANNEIAAIQRDYSASNLGSSAFAGKQSGETWGNSWSAATGALQNRMQGLQHLYSIAQAALAGAPVPAEVPGLESTAVGAQSNLEAFQPTLEAISQWQAAQQAPPAASSPPADTGTLSSGFYGGDQKRLPG